MSIKQKAVFKDSLLRVTLYKSVSVCVNEVSVGNYLYSFYKRPCRVCQRQRNTYEQINVRDEAKCYGYAIEHDMEYTLGFKAEVKAVYAYAAKQECKNRCGFS